LCSKTPQSNAETFIHIIKKFHDYLLLINVSSEMKKLKIFFCIFKKTVSGKKRLARTAELRIILPGIHQ